tara:strand:+ start:138 stop:464 length:327 start_codon:yes stop_codon:yes gene_type:complete
MGISYSWHITQLDAKIQQDNKSNVVHTVHYTYKGVKDGDKTLYYDIYNFVTLSPPSDEEFIEYDDLTKENVVSWIESIVDVEKLQDAIKAEIEQKENPTDTYLQPNWD